MSRLQSFFLNISPALLAVLLQIQITLLSSAEYAGLRINIADLLLPILGMGVFASLLLRGSQWPMWQLNHMWWWLVGLFTVMSLSLLNGYFTGGELSNWALINKYAGFAILLSYLALGGWIAQNAVSLSSSLALFARFFVYMCLSVLCVSLLYTLIQPLLAGALPRLGRWEGLMGNRNVFVLVVLFSIMLVECYRASGKPLIPQWVYFTFWSLMPVFAAFNGSRTGWICSALLLLGFLIRTPKHFVRHILPWLLLGSVFVAALYTFTPVKNPRLMHQYDRLVAALVPDQEVTYGGDQKRLIALEDALELYSQSNPLLGSGLGTFKDFQSEKRGEFVDIIDCTPLWLLTEFGLIGFLSFGIFFLLVLKNLFQKRKNPFHRALLYFLIFFAGISLLHEIMYTRFLWFALGMALIATKDEKEKLIQ
ncbi:MAG: O-antigen ligase family protein [Alphaproteobacteria bacterium]|nr:O-antigen ligase family protein [Alphaproteobacteria bacterium]